MNRSAHVKAAPALPRRDRYTSRLPRAGKVRPMQTTLPAPTTQLAELQAELAATHKANLELCKALAALDEELASAYALLAVWMPGSPSVRALHLIHGGAA